MKPSYDTVILRDDSGAAHSIFSKGDFTAEHEGNLGELHRLMEAAPDTYQGLASYGMGKDAAERVARCLAVFEQSYSWREEGAGKGGKDKQRRGTALCMRLSYDWSERDSTIWDHWRRNEASELSCSWSDSGFEIMAYSDGAKTFLNDVAAAIREGDFACFRGGGNSNPFDRGGLVLCIPSRVPKASKDQMAKAHAERKRLLDAAEATGIERRLRERIDCGSDLGGFRPFFSEYRYYALAPAWSETIRDRGEDRGGIVETKHPVVFFLNPGSENAESGWYTVEELDDWLAGKGPVLRKRAQESGQASPRL